MRVVDALNTTITILTETVIVKCMSMASARTYGAFVYALTRVSSLKGKPKLRSGKVKGSRIKTGVNENVSVKDNVRERTVHK